MFSIHDSIKSPKTLGLCIFSMGVILRLLLIPDHWMSLDDLYTITITGQDSFTAAWTNKILAEPHPPLFNSAVYLWTRLFSDSTYSLHSLSAVFSFIVLFFIYKDGRHILPQGAFILYFTLAALTPVSLRMFLEVRSYTFYYPASMLATLYFIAIVKSRNESTDAYTVKFVCWALIAALSHYFGMALIFFQLFYVFLLTLVRKSALFSKRNFLLALPALISLLWFAFHIDQIKNNQIDSTWIYPTGLKYCVGYLMLVFGTPLPRIAASNDPQSLISILHSPLELLNVISICIPFIVIALIFIGKAKSILNSFVRANEEKDALLASAYLAVVPFCVFFVIGKIIPIVNWKYMMGYTPGVWMFFALLLGATGTLRSAARFLWIAVIVSCFLYFPGLMFIPRMQIGEALQESVVLSDKMNIPLVLPNLMEYKFFIDDKAENNILWHDIDMDNKELPDNFLSVFGHCTPTVDISAPSSCVRAEQSVLKRYSIERVWRYALSGIYQFKLKEQ